MIPMRRILFPVDFSDSCLGAAKYVEFFAGRFDAGIALLHVVRQHALLTQIPEGIQARLDDFLRKDFEHFATRRICILGEPAAEIVAFARRWSPDLVMLPTHGTGLYRRLLVGSVAATVLHDLDCPVWTSVHTEAAPFPEQIHCRRILCAIDPCQRTRNDVQWAAELAEAYEAELGIVHATIELPAGYPGLRAYDDFTRAVAVQANSRIETLLREMGLKCRVLIHPGEPALVVTEAVREFGADLLVIGRKGRGGEGGHLHKHAYAILRDSPCPVVSI